MDPRAKRHLQSALVAVASLYAPITFQLLTAWGRWGLRDATLWILAAPGFAPVVYLNFGDHIPGDWPMWVYLGSGILLTVLFIAGLTLLGARNRTWQIVAILLGSALGGFAAWIGWALTRME